MVIVTANWIELQEPRQNSDTSPSPSSRKSIPHPTHYTELMSLLFGMCVNNVLRLLFLYNVHTRLTHASATICINYPHFCVFIAHTRRLTQPTKCAVRLMINETMMVMDHRRILCSKRTEYGMTHAAPRPRQAATNDKLWSTHKSNSIKTCSLLLRCVMHN